MSIKWMQYLLQVGLRPKAIIVDSIQTVYLDHVTGSAGSVSQVGPPGFGLLLIVQQQADCLGESKVLKAQCRRGCQLAAKQ